ncbi:MAG: nucleotidyl transferase AbiEii/AbiGii toxin family protein [Acidimicrobiaceae bacterium]|nr:nucleotidyl transferase AbiEii/AbiGii toxin family protein [Acidimicrobiaceae bacterium]
MERDYWMSEVSRALIMESEKYPGSYTSMGGGSLLSLVGITERLSEDVDINVTFVDGADACKPKWGKRLMEECQAHVEADLGIKGYRDPNGGGNFFRTVYYPYPSVLSLPGEDQPEIKSDQGLRDAPRQHLIEMDGMPYMGRVAKSQSQPLGLPVLSDLLPRTILGTHPQQVLADKLDAVSWREGLVPTKGDEALNKMVERIRDHYDIYCLIKWLRANHMLDADGFLATVERTKEQERELRERLRITRPERDRPREGYDTLRVWTPGTQEHSTLSAQYPSLRPVVYGHLPSWDDVCDMVRSAQGVI